MYLGIDLGTSSVKVVLMNDQQTHTIPADGEMAEKLAHFLNFKDLKSFKD